MAPGAVRSGVRGSGRRSVQMPIALPRRMAAFRFPPWWLMALVTLGALGLAYLAYTRLLVAPAPVVTGTPIPIRRGTVAATVASSGTVAAARLARLTFNSGGRVKEVLVKLGDSVVAGQPLVRLDSSTLELKLDGARSSQRQAEIKVQQLKDGATQDEIAAAEASVQAAQSK